MGDAPIDVVVVSQEGNPELFDLGRARTVRPETGAVLPVFVLDRYEDIRAALLDPNLSRTFDNRSYREGNIREGIVSVAHGSAHRARRRVENAMFRPDVLRLYERELFPRVMHELLDILLGKAFGAAHSPLEKRANEAAGNLAATAFERPVGLVDQAAHDLGGRADEDDADTRAHLDEGGILGDEPPSDPGRVGTALAQRPLELPVVEVGALSTANEKGLVGLEYEHRAPLGLRVERDRAHPVLVFRVELAYRAEEQQLKKQPYEVLFESFENYRVLPPGFRQHTSFWRPLVDDAIEAIKRHRHARRRQELIDRARQMILAQSQASRELRYEFIDHVETRMLELELNVAKSVTPK